VTFGPIQVALQVANALIDQRQGFLFSVPSAPECENGDAIGPL
jgi:hypothetical protein